MPPPSPVFSVNPSLNPRESASAASSTGSFALDGSAAAQRPTRQRANTMPWNRRGMAFRSWNQPLPPSSAPLTLPQAFSGLNDVGYSVEDNADVEMSFGDTGSNPKDCFEGQDRHIHNTSGLSFNVPRQHQDFAQRASTELSLPIYAGTNPNSSPSFQVSRASLDRSRYVSMPNTPSMGGYPSHDSTSGESPVHPNYHWRPPSTPRYPTYEQFRPPSPMTVDSRNQNTFHRALSSSALFERPENSWGQSPAQSSFSVDDQNSPDLSPLPFLRDLPPRGSIAPTASTSSLDSGLSSPINRLRDHKISKTDVAYEVLKKLQKAKLTLTDLIGYVMSGEGNFLPYRKAFLGEKNSQALLDVFTKIFDDSKGAELTRDWLLPRAVDLVCETIHREMEQAKPLLRMNANEVTPEFIDSWDINEIMEPVEKLTPTWSAVFEAAAESKISKKKPKTAKSRNRKTGTFILHAGVHYLRSFRSCKVQIGLSLMGWSSGISKAFMSVLHHSCLSIEHSTIDKIITALANGSIEQARKIASDPHGVGYDNVNVSTSIFVEQVPGMPSKVQSGTLGVIYELLNARPEHMKVKPMVENFRNSGPLLLFDVRPKIASIQSYATHTNINIVDILFKNTDGFDPELKADPRFQHPPRRIGPTGHKTKFYPLRATTIEEASVEGNLAVHDDIYTFQLDRKTSDLSENAIPSYNDQLTNARIRGAQELRRMDISSWERREVFQLAFGTFHLVMNLLWALLHTHRGSIGQVGSLTYFFSILDKTRLGGEHPDYHTLLTALTQVLEGLILNAWRAECGKESLEDFAKSNPSAEEILQLASKIVERHTVPEPMPCKPANPKVPLKDLDPATDSSHNGNNNDLADEDNTPATDSESGSDSDSESDDGDIVRENIVLLTRDLLYVIELVNAIQTGDFGRIEDILPTLACMFRGAGSNNYSTEILHLLFNIKEVWTPEFANIMRDNMLVNVSGHPGHWMAIDLNIEHLIGYLKALFAAKGIYSNWERLGNIAAAINHLQAVKKQVSRSLKSGYQGNSHAKADLSVGIHRISNKARELQLEKKLSKRPGNESTKQSVDLIRIGYQKFESSSLATFNKKIEDSKHGILSISEVDEIAPLGINVRSPDDDDDSHIDQESVLHDDTTD